MYIRESWKKNTQSHAPNFDRCFYLLALFLGVFGILFRSSGVLCTSLSPSIFRENKNCYQIYMNNVLSRNIFFFVTITPGSAVLQH